jgi:hypothetical protein
LVEATASPFVRIKEVLLALASAKTDAEVGPQILYTATKWRLALLPEGVMKERWLSASSCR